MNKNHLRRDYERRKHDFSRTLDGVNKQINLVSNLRLFVAAVFIVLVYFSFKFSTAIYGDFISVAVFLYLVKRHSLLFEKKVHLENLVMINKNEARVMEGDFHHFNEGKRFIDPHHPYTHDLDVFGPGSLYQYLNRCNLHSGQRKLANMLCTPASDANAIIENQVAVKELGPLIDFRQHFQAAGMEAHEQHGDTRQLLAWLKEEPFIPVKPWMSTVLIGVPALTLICLVGAFFFPLMKIPLFLFICTQWVIAGTYLKKINVFHDYITRKKNILKKYSILLLQLEQNKFETPKLRSLSTKAHDAYENVARLASLVSALDARTNAIMTFFVNSLLLYDLQCVYRLERWKIKNSIKLPAWIDVISEAEVLNSFATFHYNHPDFCFATISKQHEIRATDMAHPLIKEEERIANTLELGPAPAVAIITGANMAGKSTFLRTLGVNMILALNGAPICAKSFSCGLMELRSGMRTADSLKDHQSYFFAELNRLKGIMDDLRDNKHVLILLDEILKGTNSNDKQAGSIALVKQLLPYPALTIIATHDLALGKLEEEYPERVINYCFEANIQDDQLSFDYKLKRGLAQRMNASFLMKKMGIIP